MSSLWRSLWAAWVQLQVSRHGQYSLARLAALDTYCQSTSWPRLLCVLSLCVLPAVVAVGCVNLIPLTSPAAGWASNRGFWIQTVVATFLITHGVLQQARHMIPELPLSSSRLVVVSFGVGVGEALALMLLASLWAFPIPFTLFTGSGVFILLLNGLSALAIGPQTLHTVPMLWPRVLRLAGLAATQIFPIIIYPAYNSLYVVMSPHARLSFIFVLPLTRVVLQNVVAHLSEFWHDLVPVTAALTIEVFSSYYVVMFMQNTGSALSAVVLLVVDVTHLAWTIRRTIHHIEAILSLHPKHRPHGRSTISGLMETSRKLCLTPDPLNRSPPRDVQVFVNSQTREASDALQENSCVASAELLQPSTKAGPSLTRVVPVDAARQNHGHLGGRLIRAVLFEYEYIVLVEYVECVVPVIFIASTTLLRSLPNIEFYPSLRDTPLAQIAATNRMIMWYALLQLLTLLALHVALRRRLGFSLLHQLAFAIESHVAIIQNNLIMSVTLVSTVAMVHMGFDFTFQFKWISQPTQ